MPITLILTPFDHFHFRPALAVKCIHDLRICHNKMGLVSGQVEILRKLEIVAETITVLKLLRDSNVQTESQVIQTSI